MLYEYENSLQPTKARELEQIISSRLLEKASRHLGLGHLASRTMGPKMHPPWCVILGNYTIVIIGVSDMKVIGNELNRCLKGLFLQKS